MSFEAVAPPPYRSVPDNGSLYYGVLLMMMKLSILACAEKPEA